jgi:hypothetical protein
MTLSNYPANRSEAQKYAKDLTRLHGKNWIPIEREKPLLSKLIPDFAAIEESEPMIVGWRKIA